MAILFHCPWDNADQWLVALQAALPNEEFRIWPDVGEAHEVEVALVWDPMQEQLLRFPNLKLIASLGAGVDHLLATTTLPDDVPMTRIVDGNLTQGMSEYVLLQTLFCHRQVSTYVVGPIINTYTDHGDCECHTQNIEMTNTARGPCESPCHTDYKNTVCHQCMPYASKAGYNNNGNSCKRQTTRPHH